MSLTKREEVPASSIDPPCEHRWKDHPHGPYCEKCKSQPESPAEALNAYRELLESATSFTSGAYTIKCAGSARRWLVLDDTEHWCGRTMHSHRDDAFAEAGRLTRGEQKPR